MPGRSRHIDIKKLGVSTEIGIGLREIAVLEVEEALEYAFVAIDDHARLAHVELFRAETAESAVRFLDGVIGFFRRHGIRIRALLTDNGSAFLSHAFEAACQRFRIRQKRTRPYRPQTNGKAERFIGDAPARMGVRPGVSLALPNGPELLDRTHASTITVERMVDQGGAVPISRSR